MLRPSLGSKFRFLFPNLGHVLCWCLLFLNCLICPLQCYFLVEEKFENLQIESFFFLAEGTSETVYVVATSWRPGFHSELFQLQAVYHWESCCENLSFLIYVMVKIIAISCGCGVHKMGYIISNIYQHLKYTLSLVQQF